MVCRLFRDWPSDNPDPSTVACCSNKICKWVCHKCSHVWSTKPNSREMDSSDCPQCWQKRNGTVKLPLLVDAHPELAAEWVPHPNLRPIHSLTAGSEARGKWWCPVCKGIYEAMVYKRVRGSGCPKPSCVSVRRLGSELLRRCQILDGGNPSRLEKR